MKKHLLLAAGILFTAGLVSCDKDIVTSSSSSSSGTSSSETASSSSSSSVDIDEDTSTDIDFSVGEITVNKIQVDAKISEEDKLSFDANYVEGGRVTSSDPNGKDDLDLTLEVTISGDSNLWKNMALTFNSSLKEGEGEDAVQKNYVALPENVTLSKEDLTIKEDNEKEGVDQTVTYTYEVSFNWGSKFNHKNPSNYYSEDEAGLLIPISEVVSTMEDMVKTISNTSFSIVVNINNK